MGNLLGFVLMAVVFIIVGGSFLVLCGEFKKTLTLNTEWQGPVDEAPSVAMLLEDILMAKSRILIYAGQLGDIFSRNDVIEALKKKEIPIEIFSEVNLPLVEELAKGKENVSFISSYALLKHRGKPPGNHFRVVDWDYVYLEKFYRGDSTKRFFKRLPNTRFAPATLERKFQKIKYLAWCA